MPTASPQVFEKGNPVTLAEGVLPTGDLASSLILVDCSELSADEKLALASQLSDRLEGVAVALIKGKDIVLDPLSDESLDPSAVKDSVTDFVSRRKDSAHYAVEAAGERIVVRSADPVPSMRKKKQNQLPPNLKQCAFCGFVTEYDDILMLHTRLHGGAY